MHLQSQRCLLLVLLHDSLTPALARSFVFSVFPFRCVSVCLYIYLSVCLAPPLPRANNGLTRMIACINVAMKRRLATEWRQRICLSLVVCVCACVRACVFNYEWHTRSVQPLQNLFACR